MLCRVVPFMLAFACFGTAEPAFAQRRVASLNLCTDELLLLLADPRQIVSVSHLSHQPAESPLWREARRHDANDGSIVSAVRRRPDLVLTMGGGFQDRAGILGRLGIRLLDLPYPASLTDVAAGVRAVGTVLGRDKRAALVAARMERLAATRARQAREAVWLGTGGSTVAATGLAAQWMRLAGLAQRPLRGDRVTLEELALRPPPILLRSEYRSRDFSLGRRWLAHPLVRRGGSRDLVTDGRRWTCLGPLMIPEVERLRRELAQ
jgi:iron complex transport system substrate-binding protein